MPPESPLRFGLIETLRWTRGEGYWLLPHHAARLDASARALGFEDTPWQEALNAAVQGQTGTRRVRLVRWPDGRVGAEAYPITLPPPGTVWRAAVADERFRSDDPLLRHKTTHRDRYEGPLAAATARGFDEVVFLNERGEVCEGARTSLFLEDPDGTLLTPPLACGLLPGTLRASLLAEGRAREAVLRLDDLEKGQWSMGNAVRGLVRARLE
ncbi:MAG: aminotransferase class IV family protein [Geminicoccaceae bacterium]|nr:aminotransferase class IV family protein [Geminicoccaceae bacterium]